MFDWLDFVSATSRQSSEALRLYVEAEHPGLQSAVLTSFAILNSIRVFAYVPQIVKVARDTSGASAVSNFTWVLFLASHLTTILYALLVLGDPLMAVIFVGNAAACLAIVAITCSKRRSFARRLRASAA